MKNAFDYIDEMLKSDIEDMEFNYKKFTLELNELSYSDVSYSQAYNILDKLSDINASLCFLKSRQQNLNDLKTYRDEIKNGDY